MSAALLEERIVAALLREICDGTFGHPREWSLTEYHHHQEGCPEKTAGEGTSRVCCIYDKMIAVVTEALSDAEAPTD